MSAKKQIVVCGGFDIGSRDLRFLEEARAKLGDVTVLLSPDLVLGSAHRQIRNFPERTRISPDSRSLRRPGDRDRRQRQTAREPACRYLGGRRGESRACGLRRRPRYRLSRFHGGRIERISGAAAGSRGGQAARRSPLPVVTTGFTPAMSASSKRSALTAVLYVFLGNDVCIKETQGRGGYRC